MKTRPKTTVIGAGFVGSTVAQYLALKELSDIVIVDLDEGIAKGKALDLSQSLAVFGIDLFIVGTASYEETADSDIVVITAGIPRKPGMSRDELLSVNAKIVKNISEKIKKYSPNAIVIAVTNPLDAMVYLVHKITQFPPHRIIGMAGVLDSARMRTMIAKELNSSVCDVDAFVLGGHGDSMVPMIGHVRVGGRPLLDVLSEEKTVEIVERTKNGGAEIVAFLKTGSAYFAPAASVVQMVESILKDQKRILPCCAYLSGQYGINGLFIGVPVVLGRSGVEKIIEVNLDADEKMELQKTADSVKKLIEKLGE